MHALPACVIPLAFGDCRIPVFVAVTLVEGYALPSPNTNPGSVDLDRSQGRGYECRKRLEPDIA